MAIQSLEIQGFRNLKQVSLSPKPGLNFFIGANGSGKTSLLEAIHCLGRGKSFRTHKTDRLIRHENNSFLIVSRITQNGRQYTIGMERTHGQSQIHLSARPIQKSSELTQILPVAVLEPALHRLIEEGPEYRRKFIDWGVFHVEHGFHSVWSQYRRLLAQRNAALKNAPDYSSIKIWDKELGIAAENLNTMRRNYLKQFISFVPDYTNVFVDIADVELSYYQGWREGESFSNYLAAQFSSDKERGFTQFGPHRADLRIRINGVDAREYLSRGQQKVFVAALILAQCQQMQINDRSVVLLVDDLPSELDTEKRARLLEMLVKTEAQVFLTGTEQSHFPQVDRNGEQGMFHVKHGSISSED